MLPCENSLLICHTSIAFGLYLVLFLLNRGVVVVPVAKNEFINLLKSLHEWSFCNKNSIILATNNYEDKTRIISLQYSFHSKIFNRLLANMNDSTS